jgi:3-phosphoshikimate 1-carboxyvinyltransferase
MDAHIEPSTLSGVIEAVASKSMAHRLMILNALAEKSSPLTLTTTSDDIEATKRSLIAIQLSYEMAHNKPVDEHMPALVDVGESGSTLRFLLPYIGAKGVEAHIMRHGRLCERPLSPFDDELRAHGMTIVEDGGNLMVKGRLEGGRFTLPGNVSSQYISALLMAAPALAEAVEVYVSLPVESRPYIELTVSALETFGVNVTSERTTIDDIAYERYCVQPTPLVAPDNLTVEGDWSNAAFWLAAGAMEFEGLSVSGLNLQSVQGDRQILAALAAFGARIARRGGVARATKDRPRAATINVQAIPDLVPPLAALAATSPGTTTLSGAARLRLKESDRLETVSAAINALGGHATINDDKLLIEGTEQLAGGTLDAAGDHRIAMMGAIMATHAREGVVILGAHCVEKSYPTFWDDYAKLGGKVHLI